MSTIRIKEAILRYNAKLKQGQEKMTQSKLGAAVLPGMTETYIRVRISRWSNGESLTGLRIEHIKKICETLKCDANYLLNIKAVKD